MKFKISTIVVWTALLATAAFFILTIKYSIVDIDPDTYKKKLNENDTPVYLHAIDNYNPDAIRLSYSFDLDDAEGANLGVKIERRGNRQNDRMMVSIHSNTSGFWYNVFFDKSKTPIGYIISGRNAKIFYKICEKLMTEDGFILKKSKLISDSGLGYDILIKETEDSFIICELASKFEDIKENNILDMTSIRISTYSKYKFRIWL